MQHDFVFVTTSLYCPSRNKTSILLSLFSNTFKKAECIFPAPIASPVRFARVQRKSFSAGGSAKKIAVQSGKTAT